MHERAARWPPRALRLTLLVIGLVTSCTTQPAHPSHLETDTICSVPNHFPFGAFTPSPEPVCLPTDAPLPTPDEFLSFEEWKSLKLEEHAIPHQDRATNPNPSDPSLHAPELITDIAAPSTSDGNLPLPSLRVPLTDRFNYASSECSARIQSSHKSVKSPWAILNSKRDKYMLSPCSAREKFIVVELCDDIQVDTIQLANFEFFSGVFKDISISASQTYDADHWHFLGTFRAKNIRTVQSFLLPRDSRFFRYIRIEFLSHYGSEYYCPVTLMRVYGLTQIEEYKWDEWQAAWRREHETGTRNMLPSSSSDIFVAPAPVETLHDTARPTGISDDCHNTQRISSPPAESPSKRNGSDTSNSGGREAETLSSFLPFETGTLVLDNVGETSIPLIAEDVDAVIDDIIEYIPEGETSLSKAALAPFAEVQQSASDSLQSTEASTAPPSPPTSSLSSSDSQAAVHINATAPAASRSQNQTSSSSTNFKSISAPMKAAVNTSSSLSSTPRSTIVTVLPPRPTGAAVPVGHTGGSESIYRNIMNRLTILESNSSLGVRYVEDQTRYVREALKRLEQDVGRLESLNNQQQASYRRTVLELQQHKRETEAERSTLLLQLEALSDEVLLEKRLGLAQLCLLLVVLIFMAFTRSATLGIPFRDTVSVSNDTITSPKRGPGLWRFKRTASEPERSKIATELAVQPSKSSKPTSSAGEYFRRRIGPSTPIPLPSPNVGRRFANVPSPPSGTPFVPNDPRSSATVQGTAKGKRPLEDSSQRPHAVCHPSLTPPQPVSGTPVRDEPFHPGSIRRALAKTAHIHEVGRHRRANSSRGRQSPGTLETSGSPSRTTHTIDSNEENEPRRRSVFNAAKTPTGTPRRSGSQPRTRGSSGLRGIHSPSASASPFAHLNRSPPRCAKPIGLQKHAENFHESASGSDLWEDTSDAADGDDEEALAEALFNPKSPDPNEALRSAENLPKSSPGQPRRPLKFNAEQPSWSPTCSPGTATRNVYVSEARGAHLPVALQS